MQTDTLLFPASVVQYMGAGDPDNVERRVRFYAQRVKSEYQELCLGLLPVEAKHILDIGCGLGGIDCHLSAHYPAAKISLMDGRGDQSNRQMGYHPDTQAWADVAIARQLVKANGGKNVTGALADPKRTFNNVDLVISFKSWGHHYPISVYLPLVLRSLAVGGTLIVDLRKGAGGQQELEAAGFELVATVQDKSKCNRVVMRRVR